MFINSIEMSQNARLMIRGTSYMKVDFKEIHQLILGTNGCGKSTLIRELSPMPPSGSDYLKGGYKIINIEHKGVYYTLSSHFNTQAGKHSFYNDNEEIELNEGGTQSVQKTLISEIFNYDQSLHDVLTDQLKFTDMTLLQRRHWLTRISGSNLDFAIELFNKLKRAERDEDAVVKHLTNRLNKESDDMPSVDDINALQHKFNTLDERIKQLYAHRNTDPCKSTEEMLAIVQKYTMSATQCAQSLLRIKDKCSHVPASDMDELRQMQYQLKERVSAGNLRIDALYTEHNEITKMLGDTEELSSKEQQEQMRLRIDEVTNEINDIKSRLRIIHDCENANMTHGILTGISSTVYGILVQMPDNTDGYFSKDKRLALEKRVEDTTLQLTNLARAITNFEHEIIHIEKADSSICPKCNHSFKAGVREEQLPFIKQKLLEAQAEYDELSILKDTLIESLSEYVSFRNLYLQYSNLLTANNNLPFLRDRDLLNFNEHSPTYILDRYRGYVTDVEKLARIEKLTDEMLKMTDVYNKALNVNASTNYTTERLRTIENEVVTIKGYISEANAQLNDIHETCELYGEIIRKHQELERELDILDKARKQTVISAKKHIVETAITEVNTDLAVVNMQLNQARNRQNIVDDVSRQRDIVMNRAQIYKILVNEINPTTGLIADYFKQFIHQFVEQMNIIINKVWEHDIELLPCDVNSDGISYKFPLRINNRPYGPADGSKGSNSQVSMVNFAFKIVVMVYLGLDDYPLYLDELAPDLDEKHRVNIISFVRSFVESKRCSQLFLVSHYASGYGAFVNAEILILDEENLLNVPQVFNQHVKMIKDNSLMEH